MAAGGSAAEGGYDLDAYLAGLSVEMAEIERARFAAEAEGSAEDDGYALDAYLARLPGEMAEIERARTEEEQEFIEDTTEEWPLEVDDFSAM